MTPLLALNGVEMGAPGKSPDVQTYTRGAPGLTGKGELREWSLSLVVAALSLSRLTLPPPRFVGSLSGRADGAGVQCCQSFGAGARRERP